MLIYGKQLSCCETPMDILNLQHLKQKLSESIESKISHKKSNNVQSIFSCTIAPCLCELDISILDRLNAVLNSSVFYCAKNHGSTIDEVESKQAIQPKTNCIIESSSIDIRLRFPCTDLRPIHNTERIPWWKRNVLRDFFFINFCQVKIEYNAPSKYEIIANKIDLYYCVSIFKFV